MAITAHEAQEGAELEGTIKVVTLERMRAFSGGPSRNIHTDEAFARQCGLPAPIASGVMSEGYLVALMLDVFGDAWLVTGRMELAFVRVVQPGDRLTPKAVVRQRQPQGAGVQLTLDVWCENQHGERVTAGVATGTVR